MPCAAQHGVYVVHVHVQPSRTTGGQRRVTNVGRAGLPFIMAQPVVRSLISDRAEPSRTDMLTGSTAARHSMDRIRNRRLPVWGAWWGGRTVQGCRQAGTHR